MQFVNIDVDTSGLYQVPTSDKGTVAIVGCGTGAGTGNTPVRFGSYAEVDLAFPDETSANELAPAIKLAFLNGASSVWAVDLAVASAGKTAVNIATALDSLAAKDVQIVMIANTTETTVSGSISTALKEHVAAGAAATERIGVFMLEATEDSATMPAAIASALVANTTRLMAIAHNNGTTDVAAAVAGLLSSLDPWESPVMKTISGLGTPTADFTTTQFSAMATAHINPIFDPLYFAGNSLVLKSEYTLGAESDGIYLVDVRRAIDDIVYKLKTGLTIPAVIGNIRVNKSGMASLRNYINSIMQTAVNDGEIDSFAVNIPVATALAVDVNSRTTTQALAITTARTNRNIDVEIAIEYSGAVHTLDIDVLFSA